MATPFDMNYFLAFGFIGLCIFIGVFLRAKIKLFQRFLVPACLIGGLFGMAVVNLGLIPLNIELFQGIAYHFFIISFISIGLTREEKKPGETGQGREVLRGGLWMGLINGLSMTTQALLGSLLALGLAWVGVKVPLQFGLFLPLGFTQGPGQALVVGKVWEAGGFTDAVTLGLAFAAIGFFFALFLGVPLINWGVKKGYSSLGREELPGYFRRGFYSALEPKEPAGVMTTHTGNVDALAFQASAVGIVYMITYLIYYCFNSLAGSLPEAVWGFFFFFGMVAGILVRTVMQRSGVGHLLDPELQTRITSFSVDVLVTATLVAVELSVVWDYIVPLLVVTVAGGLWTTWLIIYFGRRVGGFGFERMIAQYGINTGTVSTGLVLLRVVDPGFKTRVALEVGIYALFALPFIMGTMLVIMFAPRWGLGALAQIGIFLGMTLIALTLLKVFKLWGKRTW
ncbi:MAG: hypothetical protein V1816_17825 [Pseudomonadota bacterium]